MGYILRNIEVKDDVILVAVEEIGDWQNTSMNKIDWKKHPDIVTLINKSWTVLKDWQLSEDIYREYAIKIPPETIRNLRRREGWIKQDTNGTKHKFEKAVAITCLHAPYHDERLFKLLLQFLQHFKPDYLFLLGDISDWYPISNFNKNPKRLNDLGNELKCTRKLLKEICKASPASKKKLIKGNHEDRLRRYLWKHPEIASLGEEFLNIPQLLKLKDYGIAYSEKGFDYHSIYIAHGHRLSKYSAYSAKLAMDDNTCNLIQGHSHRGGTHYKTVWRRGKCKQYVAHEAFCMCSLNPEYIDRPNWQHGWICIYTDPKSDYFQIMPVCVVDYKFQFNGKMFNG